MNYHKVKTSIYHSIHVKKWNITSPQQPLSRYPPSVITILTSNSTVQCCLFLNYQLLYHIMFVSSMLYIFVAHLTAIQHSIYKQTTIYSSKYSNNRYLGCFHFGTIINNVIKNIIRHVFWYTCTFNSVMYLEMKLLNHRMHRYSVLIDAAKQFSEVAKLSHTLPNSI